MAARRSSGGCGRSASRRNKYWPESWSNGGAVTSPGNGGHGLPGKSVKVDWDASKTVAENASEELPRLARGFLEAGHALAAKDPSFDALHRFRLLTKRFRYTLE